MLKLLNDSNPADYFPGFARGDRFEGIVCTVGEGKVSLAFPADHQPAERVGDNLTGRVFGGPNNDTVDFQGEVIVRVESSSAIILEMDVPTELFEAVQQMVERRGSQRISMPDHEPYHCLAGNVESSESFEVEALDISSTGMRIFASSEISEGLLDCRELRILCRLPGDLSAFEVDAKVRFQSELDAGLIMGVEFMIESANEYHSMLRRIEHFANRRLAEALSNLIVEDS